MIYRFTNSKGRQAYGVIIEPRDKGAYILLDTYEIKPGVTNPARFCYISLEPNPYVTGATKDEVLPLETNVVWHTQLIAECHAAMRAGNGADWIEANREAMGKMIAGH